MKILLSFLILLLLLVEKGNAQEKFGLFGKLIFENSPIVNAHVFNKNTFEGTISNDAGSFEINVRLNDTLLISSLEYELKKVVVSKEIYKVKQLIIRLTPAITNLKEVFIKGLTGNLAYDFKNKPKETTPTHNYNKLDLNTGLTDDIHGSQDAPFAGSDRFKPSAAGIGIPNFQLEKEHKLKRELAKKIDFPFKIKRDFGLSFFTDELKIPKEKIDHFLAFCEFFDIIDLYYAQKKFQVIEILKRESVLYNEIKE
ncbi:MAG: carboxypeptidase-like regulatory domain-containing protein [Lutibacter sp.]|nr:carboxypeptidase-like regulatory domain-containing protein [Lutibacter sp.]